MIFISYNFVEDKMLVASLFKSVTVQPKYQKEVEEEEDLSKRVCEFFK